MPIYWAWKENITTNSSWIQLIGEVWASREGLTISNNELIRFWYRRNQSQWRVVYELLTAVDGINIICEIFGVPSEVVEPVLWWKDSERKYLQRAFHSFSTEFIWLFWSDSGIRFWTKTNREYLNDWLQALALICWGKNAKEIEETLWISYDIIAKSIKYTLKHIRWKWDVFFIHLLNSKDPDDF